MRQVLCCFYQRCTLLEEEATARTEPTVDTRTKTNAFYRPNYSVHEHRIDPAPLCQCLWPGKKIEVSKSKKKL